MGGNQKKENPETKTTHHTNPNRNQNHNPNHAYPHT